MSSAEKIMKILFQVFVLAIALYALLCTVYSDVIIQNDNEFYGLSKLTLPDKPLEKNFYEMIGKKAEANEEDIGETVQDRILYIFVLDISGSIINKDINKIPKNLDDRITDIDKTYNNQIDVKKDINVLNLSKLRLYELFIGLYNNPEVHKNDIFSIWTLGDEGKRQYPVEKKRAKVEEEEIIKALKTISGITIEKPDNNTDFDDLLDMLKKNYKTEFENSKNADYKPPDIVITFISDLLHDVDSKKSINVNENWEKLKRKIEDLCNSRIMVNLIILSDLDLENQRSIFPLFKDHLEWHFLKKDFIWADRSTDLLFPVAHVNDNITFYYLNPIYIADASVILKFPNNSNDSNKIRVSLLGEDNTPIIPRISIQCEVPGTERNKKIFSSGSHFETDVKTDQTIRLTYKNRIPPGFSRPFFKISDFSKRTSYLIPIYFTKKIPGKVFNLFRFLQWLIIILPFIIAFIAMLSVNTKWKALLIFIPTIIYFIVLLNL